MTNWAQIRHHCALADDCFGVKCVTIKNVLHLCKLARAKYVSPLHWRRLKKDYVGNKQKDLKLLATVIFGVEVSDYSWVMNNSVTSEKDKLILFVTLASSKIMISTQVNLWIAVFLGGRFVLSFVMYRNKSSLKLQPWLRKRSCDISLKNSLIFVILHSTTLSHLRFILSSDDLCCVIRRIVIQKVFLTLYLVYLSKLNQPTSPQIDYEAVEWSTTITAGEFQVHW